MSSKTIKRLQQRVNECSSHSERVAALVDLCNACCSLLHIDSEALAIAVKDFTRLAETSGDAGLFTWAQLYAGHNYLIRGNVESAERELTQCVQKFQNDGDLRGLHSALLALARIEVFNREVQKAEDILNRVFEYELKYGDIRSQIRVLFQFGQLYLITNRASVYMSLLEEHLTRFEQSDDRAALPEFLNRLSTVATITLNDTEKGLTYAHRARDLSLELGDTTNLCQAYTLIGAYYWYKGDVGRYLENYLIAIPLLEEEENKTILVAALVDCAYGYDLLGEYEEALNANYRARDILIELGHENRLGWVEMGIAMAELKLGNAQSSIEYIESAIDRLNRSSDLQGLGYAYFRKGEAMNAVGRFDDSIEAFELSLHNRLQLNSKHEIAETLCEKAKLLLQRDKIEDAIALLDEAVTLVASIDSKNVLSTAYKNLAEAFSRQRLFEKAYEYMQMYNTVHEQIQAQQSAKKVASLKYLFEREAHRKEQKILLDVLYKTLPRTIADRVTAGETLIADHFDSVSILFADIVGFTPMTASMAPGDILEFMNSLFAEFDAIASRHGCERIKTIGDGYMAVCGAPVSYSDHALRISSMALEMIDGFHLPNSVRSNVPSASSIQLRIGLNCGEVTAGVLGIGKLSYDLYGDSVNTAARMESHGEAGKIHVSEEFVNALLSQYTTQHPIPPQPSPEGEGAMSLSESAIEKALPSGEGLGEVSTHTSFQFIPRGEIEIKGKGLMRTYFLERE